MIAFAGASPALNVWVLTPERREVNVCRASQRGYCASDDWFTHEGKYVVTVDTGGQVRRRRLWLAADTVEVRLSASSEDRVMRRARGVSIRALPEFDQPREGGEGWGPFLVRNDSDQSFEHLFFGGVVLLGHLESWLGDYWGDRSAVECLSGSPVRTFGPHEAARGGGAFAPRTALRPGRYRYIVEFTSAEELRRRDYSTSQVATYEFTVR